jgi:cell division protein FtsL
MSRLDSLLLLVVVCCALSVVNSTYQQRRLFVQLEREQSQQHSLAQDWTRLQYEQSALSKTSRIEDVGANQLGMISTLAGRTQYLNEDGSAAQIAAAPAPESTRSVLPAGKPAMKPAVKPAASHGSTKPASATRAVAAGAHR